MTPQERVESLHTRMKTMRRVRERRKTGIIGTAGVLLSVCLVLLVFGGEEAHLGGAAGLYSGATMLFENAGGYVIAAIVAFMAGVVLTVFLIRKKNAKETNEKKERNDRSLSGNTDKEL